MVIWKILNFNYNNTLQRNVNQQGTRATQSPIYIKKNKYNKWDHSEFPLSIFGIGAKDEPPANMHNNGESNEQ